MALFVIASAVLALLALAALHFTSPEFKPNWRMISEYALGSHKWLLTVFFFCWGISSMTLSLLCFQLNTSGWMLTGSALLLVSGIGAVMGGLFDVKHKLHGLSFTLGVPTLIAAALLISYQLVAMENWGAYRFALLSAAHLTWISCVLMAITMVVMFSGFKKAGIPVGPNQAPPEEVPPGVFAVAGYANRFLVLCYVAWNILVAGLYWKFS